MGARKPIVVLPVEFSTGRPSFETGSGVRGELLKDVRSFVSQTEPDVRTTLSRARFVEHFLDYWIDLRHITLTEPDSETFTPNTTALLAESMVEETRGFFSRRCCAATLVSNHVFESEFLTINQRMAQLYGIQGVQGFAYTKSLDSQATVSEADLLTQGSLLKITANGTTTSPVVRGTFAC